MSATKIELVSKLSLKKIVGKLDVKALHDGLKDDPNFSVELFNIGGTCLTTKIGNTTYGEFCAFLGNFAAIRLADGVVFRGPQLFLPNVAEAYIRPVVDAAKGDPVEFAFIIGVKPLTKPDGTLSYEYTVSPIVAPDTIDPLAEMIKKLSGAPRLIGSSKVADETMPAKKEEVVEEVAAETIKEPAHGKKK